MNDDRFKFTPRTECGDAMYEVIGAVNEAHIQVTGRSSFEVVVVGYDDPVSKEEMWIEYRGSYRSLEAAKEACLKAATFH